jgi:hypothetical protein
LTTAGRRRASALIVATLALVAGCREEDGSVEQLCAAVADGDHGGTFTDFDPTDPEAALDQLRAARVELGELHDAAPDEVRDDLQVEIDYLQALIDALEDVPPGDPTESALQVQAVTDAHPGVDQAAVDLATFADEEC